MKKFLMILFSLILITGCSKNNYSSVQLGNNQLQNINNALIKNEILKNIRKNQ